MKQSADGKAAAADCSLPSLGRLQARFLATIATLFDAHGRLVSKTVIWRQFLI